MFPFFWSTFYVYYLNLKRFVLMTPIQPVSFDAHLDHYQSQADELLKAKQLGDNQLIQQIQKHQLTFRNWPEDGFHETGFSLVDAQQIIAHVYGFENWKELANYVDQVTQAQSAVWQFESAIEAMIIGDSTTLRSLLQDNPELVHMRSMRVHHAMLLHYIGANGVENYRQKSPANAVAITELVLKSGAEVDALADTYGKGTTLGLVATSIHPFRSGVQIPLIKTLLTHGASMDGVAGRWSPLMAALANGYPEAAETLATHGAPIDSVVAAAGLGRLDLVRGFLNETGTANTLATPLQGIPQGSEAQVESAFLYACTYGHIDVAEFLLNSGIDPNAQDKDGQSSLHCAVLGGQPDMIKWLLEHNTPLEVRNLFGGTVLGQAFWCVSNGNPAIDYVPIIATLLDAGATIEPGAITWLKQQHEFAAQTKTRIEEMLRRYGAQS
jgi:ankyrin repeat protein